MISLFPINTITDGRGEEMIYAHRGSRQGGGETAPQKAPGAWNVFLLVKTLLLSCFVFSFFLLWLEVLELFSIREAFLFVIKDWEWKYYKEKKTTKRHNNVMGFFAHYLRVLELNLFDNSSASHSLPSRPAGYYCGALSALLITAAHHLIMWKVHRAEGSVKLWQIIVLKVWKCDCGFMNRTFAWHSRASLFCSWKSWIWIICKQNNRLPSSSGSCERVHL